MGTYLGRATLIAADGTEQLVEHVSLRTRLGTWTGTLKLSDGEIADLLLPSGEGTLRLPDGSEGTVRVSAGGSFSGTPKA